MGEERIQHRLASISAVGKAAVGRLIAEFVRLCGMVAVASAVQACAVGGGLKLPAAFEGYDDEDTLRQNAAAADGCAFAGAWDYRYWYSARAGGGTFVFEVTGTQLRGASIEYGGIVTRYAHEFVIVDAKIAPNGRSATGWWKIRQLSGLFETLPVAFRLDAEGLHYEMTGGPPTGDTIDGMKRRSLPCNQPIPFVQVAFDAVLNAQPIPEEYWRK
jgi:hypothetical protein